MPPGTLARATALSPRWRATLRGGLSSAGAPKLAAARRRRPPPSSRRCASLVDEGGGDPGTRRPRPSRRPRSRPRDSVRPRPLEDPAPRDPLVEWVMVTCPNRRLRRRAGRIEATANRLSPTGMELATLSSGSWRPRGRLVDDLSPMVTPASAARPSRGSTCDPTLGDHGPAIFDSALPAPSRPARGASGVEMGTPRNPRAKRPPALGSRCRARPQILVSGRAAPARAKKRNALNSAPPASFAPGVGGCDDPRNAGPSSALTGKTGRHVVRWSGEAGPPGSRTGRGDDPREPPAPQNSACGCRPRRIVIGEVASGGSGASTC